MYYLTAKEMADMDKVLICTIDGCAKEYITEETAPEICRLMKQRGFFKTITGAMPSVTNVNHACILTGLPPKDTGIAGNYYYDPETGEDGFIEESGFLRAETIIERFHAKGLSTAIAAVKHKVIGVYGGSADYTISAQHPEKGNMGKWEHPGENGAGGASDAEAPDITTAECTGWMMEHVFRCIRDKSPDFVYCTTNDYIFHHYAPGTPQAAEQMRYIDEYIGKIADLEPDRQIYITADHGMNQKHHLLDFGRLAAENGIDLYALPPLKDRYIENHPYQEGGMLYIFMKDRSQEADLLKLAESAPEIESVLPAEKAARIFDLPQELIGDHVLFAADDCAFGEMDKSRVYTDDSRTHGSLFEREIPLIAINPSASPDDYTHNWDIVRNLHF